MILSHLYCCWRSYLATLSATVSLKAIPALLFHVAAVSIMVWAYMSGSLSPMHPIIKKRRGGHWAYLTIHGLGFATGSMGLGLICDVFPGLKAANTIKRYFMMAAMALACTIYPTYWGLLFFAPGLILPRLPSSVTTLSFAQLVEPSSKSYLIYIPLHLDLALHVTPGLAVALDFLLFEKKYTWNEAWRHAPLMIFLFDLFFGCLTEWLGVLNDGIMPYPFLTLSPFPIRVAIYSGAGLFAYLSFLLLNTIHPGRPLMASVGLMETPAQTTAVGADKKFK